MPELVEQNRSTIGQMLAIACRRLLEARVAGGHWVGELSSSALSTATAGLAFYLYSRRKCASARSDQCSRLAAAAMRWLAENQNPDGGWGDTVSSQSNISTTLLCRAALRAIEPNRTDPIRRAEAWLMRSADSLEPQALSRAISSCYGKDRTFSVPILTFCAAAGVLGPEGDAWRYVPQLPFELAAAPRGLFAFLRLPVVSYALPALIAIGQARHRRWPTRNPFARFARALTTRRTLRILETIQPPNGGFLEATPLTSFVVISLLAAGGIGATVIERGVDFLVRSMRPDGSCPIDTNLATWVTTLSVNALASTGRLDCLSSAERAAISNWLRSQQHRTLHPYTDAAPGGWAWTDLPGGVPDADDTAGALLALRNLGCTDADDAACAGVRWLLGIQNRDGGIPTFCRGWGHLPFDRSAPELTAHALRSWSAWRDRLPPPLARVVDHAAVRALAYLQASQAADGSWTPLWFGNQAAPGMANPTYGTSRVLAALSEARPILAGDTSQMPHRAVRWLLAAQNHDGGWGGAKGVASSVEETCQAVHALDSVASNLREIEVGEAISRGLDWLNRSTQSGAVLEPAPIGLYFAKLWYSERLYPLIGLASLPGEIRTPSAQETP
jgi:squalene-hopene/tetraprenyl-beta-curcumene cyclase